MRQMVNGSGNTDFRLPWDLRIVTEVMRSECRGDFFILESVLRQALKYTREVAGGRFFCIPKYARKVRDPVQKAVETLKENRS